MENEMNFGHEILKCYKKHRDNLHVANVVTMLTEMEVIYHLWDTDTKEKPIGNRRLKELNFKELKYVFIQNTKLWEYQFPLWEHVWKGGVKDQVEYGLIEGVVTAGLLDVLAKEGYRCSILEGLIGSRA